MSYALMLTVMSNNLGRRIATHPDIRTPYALEFRVDFDGPTWRFCESFDSESV